MILSICLIFTNGIISASYAADTGNANTVLKGTSTINFAKYIDATDKASLVIKKLDKDGKYSEYTKFLDKVVEYAKIGNAFLNLFRGNGVSGLLVLFQNKGADEYNIEVGINQLKESIEELDGKLDDISEKIAKKSADAQIIARDQKADEMEDRWFDFISKNEHYSMTTLDQYVSDYEAALRDAFINWYKDASTRGRNSSITAHFYDEIDSNADLNNLPIAFNNENTEGKAITETDTGIPVVETIFMSENDLAQLPAYKSSIPYQTLVDNFLKCCSERAYNYGGKTYRDAFARAMYETLINRLGCDIIEKGKYGFDTINVNRMVDDFNSYLKVLKQSGHGLDAELQKLYNVFAFEGEAKDSINSTCDLLTLKTLIYGTFIQEIIEKRPNYDETKKQNILDSWMDTILWIDNARNNALTGYDNYCYLTNTLVELEKLEYSSKITCNFRGEEWVDKTVTSIDTSGWGTTFTGPNSDYKVYYKYSDGREETGYKSGNRYPEQGIMDSTRAAILYHTYDQLYQGDGGFVDYLKQNGADRSDIAKNNGVTENWPLVTNIGSLSNFSLSDRIKMTAKNLLGNNFSDGKTYTIWDSTSNTDKFVVHDKISGDYMSLATGKLYSNKAFASRAVYLDQKGSDRVTGFSQENLSIRYYDATGFDALNGNYHHVVEYNDGHFVTLGLFNVPSKSVKLLAAAPAANGAKSTKVSTATSKELNPLQNYQNSTKKWMKDASGSEIKGSNQTKVSVSTEGALTDKILQVSDPMHFGGNKTKLYSAVKALKNVDTSQVSTNDKISVSCDIIPRVAEGHSDIKNTYQVIPALKVKDAKTGKVKAYYHVTDQDLSDYCSKFTFRLPVKGSSNTFAVVTRYDNWKDMNPVKTEKVKILTSGKKKYISITTDEIGPYSVEYRKVSVPTIYNLKGDKKSFTVLIGNTMDQYDNGYQVRYSVNKNMKKTKSFILDKSSSKTVKGLKLNKKYYVQVRSYTLINGKKVYSNWSKQKSVVTKQSNIVNVYYHYLDIVDGVNLKWKQFKSANQYKVEREGEVVKTINVKKGQKTFSFNDPAYGEGAFNYKYDKYQIKAYKSVKKNGKTTLKYLGKSDPIYILSEFGTNGEVDTTSDVVVMYQDPLTSSKKELTLHINYLDKQLSSQIPSFYLIKGMKPEGFYYAPPSGVDFSVKIFDKDGKLCPNTPFSDSEGRWISKDDIRVYLNEKESDYIIKVKDEGLEGGEKDYAIKYQATKIDNFAYPLQTKGEEQFVGLATKPDGGELVFDAQGNWTNGQWTLCEDMTLYPVWGKLVGGRIFYINRSATGGDYQFFDKNGNKIVGNDLTSLANAYYYKENGSKSDNKYYVYATTDGKSDSQPKVYSGFAWSAFGYETGISKDGIGQGELNTAEALGISKCLEKAPFYSYYGALYGYGPDSIWSKIKNINKGNLNGNNDWFIGTMEEYNQLIPTDNAFKDYLVSGTSFRLFTSMEKDKMAVWLTENGMCKDNLFKWKAERTEGTKSLDGSIVPIRSF